MSSFDLTRPVVRELRAARPRAPEGLRERVLVGARQVPEPRFALPSWLTARRVAFVAAPAVVVVGVGAALIHGIANSGSANQSAGRERTQTTAVFDSAKPTRTPGLHGARAIGAPTPLQLSKIAPNARTAL